MRGVWLGLVLAAMLAGALAAACGGDGDDGKNDGKIGGNLILATTTSVNDSGLLDALVSLFEDETGVNVKIVAVGTGAALQMGEEGNADALFVHAPASERALVESGDLTNRHVVAYNDFVVIGPSADPAGIRGERDVAAALARIAKEEARFVSRGDDSGTHKKERALWALAGVTPGGDWYEESGQGMGATLTIADQKEAYILTDRATFLALSPNLALEVMSEGDPELINIYSVMQVNPDKGKINARAAEAWVDFLLSEAAQGVVGAFRVEEFGESLFHAAGGLTEEQTIDRFRSGG